MNTLIQDLRYGIRLLLKTPGFSATAVLILALGIGANTAIFSLIDVVLLRPLPGVDHPERLVLFQRVQDGNLLGNFGYPDYLEYQTRARSFAGLAAYCGTPLSMSDGTATSRVRGHMVTNNYFSTLGVQPAVGRLLGAADADDPGSNLIAVISYAMWQNSFGADRNIVGRNIRLNGRQFAVVGVAARGFGGPRIGTPIDIWIPVSSQPVAIPRLSAGILQNRAAGWLTVFGRLNSDVREQTAQAEIDTLARQLAAAYPDTNKNRSVTLSPGIDIDPDDRSHLKTFLGLLFAAVTLLLVIGCGNVANLLLGRAAARQREMAVRRAIGAGRGRLVRQLLTEGLLLSALAGAIGILIAPWIAETILLFQPPAYLLGGLDVTPDSRILMFTVLTTFATGLLFGIAPALQSAKTELSHALKAGTAGSGLQRSILQKSLVIGQVAFSLVLLIAAGLVGRTMQNILAIDRGFETSSLLLMQVDLSIQGYQEDQGKRFYDQIILRLQALPGVTAASMAFTVPPSNYSTRRPIFYPGQEPPPSVLQGREFDLGLRVDIDTIGPGFFRSLGMALLGGRDFNAQDNDRAAAVAIVNERLAQRLWPGQNAIGKRIAMPPWTGPPRPPLEIVGIAKDTKYRSLLSDPPMLLYVPVSQEYDGRTTLIVAAKNPARLLPSIRAEIAALDKNLPVFGVETMSEHIASSLWEQRTAAGLISMFGLLALTLATTGIYGVIAYSVAQRTREMGIRMALGAARADILRLILGQGLRIAMLGVAAGFALALGATRVMASLLYGVSAQDPLTFFAISVLLTVVALAASWIPARRALSIDPNIALRHD